MADSRISAPALAVALLLGVSMLLVGAQGVKNIYKGDKPFSNMFDFGGGDSSGSAPRADTTKPTAENCAVPTSGTDAKGRWWRVGGITYRMDTPPRSSRDLLCGNGRTAHWLAR